MAFSNTNSPAYHNLTQELKSSNSTLVAVSKTKSNAAIMDLYNVGQRIFGENRVLEIVEKQQSLPSDIQWHFIGNLQRKKVKLIVPFVSLIHSVDSLALLEKIENEAAKINKNVDVLLQFYIARESSKQGLTLTEVEEGLARLIPSLEHTHITGVMGMASFIQDENRIQKEFEHLKQIFDLLKKEYFQDNPEFKTVSMGMSGDYKIAIKEGSNMVRIGSLLFGTR